MLPSCHQDQFTRNALPLLQDLPEFIFSETTTYPENLNCVVELLQGKLGDKPCISGGGIKWSYQQFNDTINQIAHLLVSNGLVTGNRVLLRGGNTPMMAACLLAVMKAGLVAVPTMPLLRTGELSHIIDKAQISFALCDKALEEELKPLNLKTLHFNTNEFAALLEKNSKQFTPQKTCRDDVCLIAFTSGTTGKPKGTLHFHRDILAMCDLFPRSVLTMNGTEKVTGTPPLAFTFGLGGLLAFPLRFGAEIILNEKYTPQTLLETIEQEGITQVYTAPTMYRHMTPLAKNYAIASLTQTISAGEALPQTTRDEWAKATGLNMIDGIGGTELIHIYISSQNPPKGAIGKVVEGYIAEIMDEDLRPLPPHMVGRLAVKGATGCKYLHDDRQTAYVQQGWNLPGDNFYKDPDGNFYYVARNDDMIVSSGYNIGAPEVEEALLTHESVLECAVIGVADETRGQAVHAFIVLKQGFKQDTKVLQDHVKATAAPYKYPRHVTFLEKLPRTETGKIQRFKLKELS